MKSTIDKINKFRDDRDWRKFHSLKRSLVNHWEE